MWEERRDARNTIAKNTSIRAAIIQPRNGAKALLACRVPDLQAYLGVCVTVDDALGHEGGADGAGDLRRFEGALAIAHDEARLADALRTQHHDLGFERRGHFFSGLGVCGARASGGWCGSFGRMGVSVVLEMMYVSPAALMSLSRCACSWLGCIGRCLYVCMDGWTTVSADVFSGTLSSLGRVWLIGVQIV